MYSAFGIIKPTDRNVWVDGLEDYRAVGAFSFMGRYRLIDFPVSNMSNSGIDCIQVYIKRKPLSLTAHLGSGRHYNINSKRGDLQVLFPENRTEHDLYNTDIDSFYTNLEKIVEMPQEYVVIAPAYIVCKMDYSELVKQHAESGAAISIAYHSVDNANESFLNCNVLTLNKQKGVESIMPNQGTAKNRNISMDTYIMKKGMFLDLVNAAHKLSSMYTLRDIVNDVSCTMDVRGIPHRGFFASITDFKSYYDANIALINIKTARELFTADWPIYTKTNDSCPTQYFQDADVKLSVVSNGCLIEGTVENSIIGRGCEIKKGAVVKNSVVLAGAVIGENVHVENQVIDKRALLLHVKEVISAPDEPGYIKRADTI